MSWKRCDASRGSAQMNKAQGEGQSKGLGRRSGFLSPSGVGIAALLALGFLLPNTSLADPLARWSNSVATVAETMPQAQHRDEFLRDLRGLDPARATVVAKLLDAAYEGGPMTGRQRVLFTLSAQIGAHLSNVHQVAQAGQEVLAYEEYAVSAPLKALVKRFPHVVEVFAEAQSGATLEAYWAAEARLAHVSRHQDALSLDLIAVIEEEVDPIKLETLGLALARLKADHRRTENALAKVESEIRFFEHFQDRFAFGQRLRLF